MKSTFIKIHHNKEGSDTMEVCMEEDVYKRQGHYDGDYRQYFHDDVQVVGNDRSECIHRTR